MLPVIGAQVTSQMNAITSSHIYCLYPDATSRGITHKAFHGDPTVDWLPGPSELTNFRKKRLEEQNLRLMVEGLNNDRPCGLACSQIQRTLAGWRGVGILHWGGYRSMKLTQVGLLPMDQEHFTWSLSDWCSNLYCEYPLKFLNWGPILFQPKHLLKIDCYAKWVQFNCKLDPRDNGRNSETFVLFYGSSHAAQGRCQSWRWYTGGWCAFPQR